MSNKYYIINNEEKFFTLMSKLNNIDCFSFDFHTTSNNHVKNINSITLGIGISIDLNNSIYIPLQEEKYNHKYTKNFNLNIIWKHVKSIFESTKTVKIGYNLKLILNTLKKHNIKLLPEKFDIMLASYALNNTFHKNFLFTNIKKYWIHEKNNNCFENTKQLSKNNTIEYTVHKTNTIYKIYLLIQKKLIHETNTYKILTKIDFRLIEVLNTIETNGVYINTFMLKKFLHVLHLKLSYLQKKIFIITKKSFNLLSNSDLLKLLPINKNYKKINKSILLELSNQYSLPRIILKYRNLHKIKTLYVEKLLLMTNQNTSRIYSSYCQVNTITSRLSCSNPNLQNIPIHNKEGKYIRQSISTIKNYRLVSADYSQFELRILAHLSKEKKFLDAFLKCQDIHSITASEIFEIPIKSVDFKTRKLAKTINFSLIYGISAFGLSKIFNTTTQQAEQYIKKYYLKHDKLFQYINEIHKKVLKTGYILTMYGRKLHIPNITSKNTLIRKSAQRTAFNAIIQGTTADIIKHSMIKIHNLISKVFPKNAKMIIQIHDELIFEVEKKIVTSFSEEIKYIMENIHKLEIPLTVCIKTGKNWLDLK